MCGIAATIAMLLHAGPLRAPRRCSPGALRSVLWARLAGTRRTLIEEGLIKPSPRQNNAKSGWHPWWHPCWKVSSPHTSRWTDSDGLGPLNRHRRGCRVGEAVTSLLCWCGKVCTVVLARREGHRMRLRRFEFVIQLGTRTSARHRWRSCDCIT